MQRRLRLFVPLTIAVTFTASLIFGSCAFELTDLGEPEVVFKVVGGNSQTGATGEELPNVLVAKLTDANGNPRIGYVVNWVIVEGGGSVWAPATTTDDKGKTKNRWTLGPEPGTNVLEVRSMAPSGKKRKHGTFSATARKPPLVYSILFCKLPDYSDCSDLWGGPPGREYWVYAYVVTDIRVNGVVTGFGESVEMNEDDFSHTFPGTWWMWALEAVVVPDQPEQAQLCVTATDGYGQSGTRCEDFDERAR